MKFLDLFKRQASPFTAQRAPLAAALEPRMLFDGAIAATAVDAATSAEPQPNAATADDTALHDAVPPAATSDQRQEVVFIDGKVNNIANVVANASPVITNLNGDAVTYVEGSAYVLLDVSSDATVSDADSANFNGGKLTAQITAGGVNGEDVLFIRNQWAGANQIAISGTSVMYNGLVVGTFTGGSNGDPLVITFTANANATTVAALVQNLAYRNSNTVEPSTASRSVSISMDDGAGGSSAVSVVALTVQSVNDAPVVNVTATNPTYTENTSAVQLFSGATINTVESGQKITEMTFTVTTVFNGAAEKLVIDGSDVTLVNSSNVVTTNNGTVVTVSVITGTASVTLSSSAGLDVATAQTILNTMAYRNDSESPTVSNRVVTLSSVTDNGGSANGGLPTASIGIFSTVAVVGVNDAPVLSGSGGSLTWTEGNNTTSIPVVIDNAVTISHADSPYIASAAVHILYNYSNGNDYLELVSNPATMGNIIGTWDAVNGTLTLTSAGNQASLAQFQAALRAVTFTNLSDSPTPLTRTVQFQVNDGSLDSAVVTRDIIITGVDDAPVISAPASTQVVEDVASVINQISISDPDSVNIYMTLNVTSGTLSATSGAGVVVGGNATTMNLSGTIAAVNAFIANNRLTYTTAANATADATLTVLVDTGSVGTDTKTITLSVVPVNDAPVVTVPVGIAVTEDLAASVTGISFSDVDAGSASVTATFSVTGGTLTALSGNGVTVTDSGTATLTLSGSLSDINAFIAAASVKYQTALDNTSSVQLTVSINDNGNTGGSAQIDTKTVTINVTAVNDAPVNNVPAAQSTSQDVVLAFNTANGNAISISDVDADGSSMIVTLGAVNGTMSLTTTSGVTLIIGSGVNNSVIRLQGSQADLNATLQNLTFKPSNGYTGPAQLTIQSNDLGNTGSGGAKSDIDTITINVTSPNPAVSNVVAYGPNGSGPYKVGDTITVEVEFNQNVYVTGGTPTLLLETGTTDRIATYTGGSGTNTLFFTYTVQAGDRSADLDYHSSSALALNGATIANSQADNAVISLPTPGSAGSLGANASLVIDGVAPTVNSATFPANRTYVAGEPLDFRFNFTEALIVDTSGNTPYLEINIGGQIRHAEYFSGSSTSTLVFRYIVQSGDSDSDGIAMSDNVRFTGDSIRDAAGNPLDPRFTAGATPGIRVDALAPEVTGISLNGPVGPGTVVFTVTFSENVSGVTGDDFSLFFTGNASGKIATVSQINGHTYTVLVDAIGGTGSLRLDLNASGTGIADAAGNPLTGGLTGASYTIDHVVPGVVPSVTSVDVPANGSYVAGQSLDFTVHLNTEAQLDTSGGTPRMEILLDNGVTAYASYLSGAGTNALVFRLTVANGQLDSNGISVGNSIQLNGGTLRDAMGNDINTALNGLGNTSGVLIDAVAPVVHSVGLPADGYYKAGDVLSFTVNLSEGVVVDASTGTPRLVLSVGGVTRYASYVPGAAGSVLLFQYTVQSGDTATAGLAIAGTLDLNGSTIRDPAGNALDRSLNGLGSISDVLIDTTPPSVSDLVLIDASPTDARTLGFTVRFNEPVTGLDLNDFSLILGGSASGTLQSLVQVDARTWRVTVANVSGQGSLGIALDALNSNITDVAGNPLSQPSSSPAYSLTALSGDPEFRTSSPAPSAQDAYTPLLQPSISGPDTVTITSPLALAPLFEPHTLGSGIPSLGNIFINNGALAPSFIAQVFGNSGSSNGSGTGFLGFGGGEGGVFGSSTLSSIFSTGMPEPTSLQAFGSQSISDINQGLRGVFGAPTLGQQLHDLNQGEQRQLRDLARALSQFELTEPNV